MNGESRATTLHPNEQDLALYAGRDLSRIRHWELWRHVSNCPACHAHVQSVRRAIAELRHEANAETLTGFEAIADWPRLEREMLGNIAVGVAAARCIDHVGRGRTLFLRSAFVFGLLALFVAGWATHIPREETDHITASLRQMIGIEARHPPTAVVRTTADGIAVRAQGATLTILHPPSAMISLSGSSAVSARFIDDETGQVTITKVYGQ